MDGSRDVDNLLDLVTRPVSVFAEDDDGRRGVRRQRHEAVARRGRGIPLRHPKPGGGDGDGVGGTEGLCHPLVPVLDVSPRVPLGLGRWEVLGDVAGGMTWSLDLGGRGGHIRDAGGHLLPRHPAALH